MVFVFCGMMLNILYKDCMELLLYMFDCVISITFLYGFSNGKSGILFVLLLLEYVMRVVSGMDSI